MIQRAKVRNIFESDNKISHFYWTVVTVKCNFFRAYRRYSINKRLCVRGTREIFRKSTVTSVTPVHSIIKLSMNTSAKIQHFSSNSKQFLNYF
jgi:hypothetical protein